MSNPVTMPMGDDYRAQGGDRNVPVPDPTRLTTQLVDRALAAFREVVETRLSGMDQATKLATSDIDKLSQRVAESDQHIRDDMDRQLTALREYLVEHINRIADVSSEKFAAITVQFADRDDRVKQVAADGDVKLNAALASQEKLFAQQNAANAAASAKQEANFIKQSDQQSATNAATFKAQDDKIAALTSRLDKLPGEQAVVTRTDKRLDNSQIIAIISVVLFAISIAVGLAIGLRG